MEFPDGSYFIDGIEGFIQHQKWFMEVVSETRSSNFFTFPVLTYSLLKRDDISEEEANDMIKTGEFHVFVDEDFARWCSDHNTEWNDSNFFMSDNVGTLSNCCFSGDQLSLTKSSDGVKLMTFKELYEAPYNETKRNFTIFHNGSWVDGKIIVLPKRKMYKIITSNKKECIVTDNHIFPTQAGDKKVKDLTTDDFLMFNSRQLDEVKERDRGYSYSQGFIIGMYLGDGSMYIPNDTATPTINFSLNEEKYDACKLYLENGLMDLASESSIHLGRITNNVLPVVIRSRALMNLIREYASGNYSYEKELSMDCLLQSAAFRKGILDGYYATDGGNSNRIYTTSRNLVRQLECLIVSLGMNSVIDCSDRTDEPVVIRGEVYKRNWPLYCIRWYDQKNRRTDKNSGFMVINNCEFYKITSIEEIKYDDEVVYCFEMANKNEPYFTLPNGIITHNCRLLSDTRKLDAFINSVGGTALCIGSCAVNTINLMRIYFESNGSKERFLEILWSKTLLCCQVLDRVRWIIHRNAEKGLLPNYIEGGVEMDKQYNTVGILGMAEVIEAFGGMQVDELGNNYYTEEGIQFASDIFRVINEVKDNFFEYDKDIEKTDEYDFDKPYSWNCESVPAEKAAVILCQKDNLIYDVNDKFIYSNQWIPLSYKCTIQEKLRVSSILDAKCSGGAISHINLESNFPDKDTAWEMLNKIALTGVIYFAFNTRINECKNHHGFVGTDHCPVCGEPVFDTYQRIVGYLVPTRSYSKDRFREFTTRQWFNYANELKDF